MKLVLKANIQKEAEKATADEKVFKILRRWDTNTIEAKTGTRQILKNLEELSPKVKKIVLSVIKQFGVKPQEFMSLLEDDFVDFLNEVFVKLNKEGFPVKNKKRFEVD